MTLEFGIVLCTVDTRNVQIVLRVDRKPQID